MKMTKFIRNFSISLVSAGVICGTALANEPNCMMVKNDIPNSQIGTPSTAYPDILSSYVYVYGGTESDPKTNEIYWIAPGVTQKVCGIYVAGYEYNSWELSIQAAPANNQPAYPQSAVVGSLIYLDNDGIMSTKTAVIRLYVNHYTSPDNIQYLAAWK